MMKFICAVILLVCVSCETAIPVKKTPPEWNTEKSTQLNRELSIEEDIDIQLYVSQHVNWNVEETGTGLRFVSIKKTTGEQASKGKQAKIHYTVSLLNGTKCYETEADELDVFQIDKSEIESGIHEGIKKMRVGEKAILIFPSHLAHGLIGDGEKIPPLSPLVIDIELIELD